MKKFLAVALLAVLLFSFLSVTASAAGTLGPNEQAVLDVIEKGDTLNVGGTVALFKVPTNYYNHAKAFFVGTPGDLTEAQRDEIIFYIQDAISLAKKETSAKPHLVSANGVVDFRGFSYPVKKAILIDGQKACAVAMLTLIFDGKKVVITGPDGTVYFEDVPIVKTTGAEIDATLPVVITSLLALFALGAVVTAKKAKLI